MRSSGRVLIDGVDIRDVTLRSLRRQISIVTQDSVVFPATIAENIAYGDPTASQADIEAAARRAFAHDFIMEKPQGYQTLLGGLGSAIIRRAEAAPLHRPGDLPQITHPRSR